MPKILPFASRFALAWSAAALLAACAATPAAKPVAVAPAAPVRQAPIDPVAVMKQLESGFAAQKDGGKLAAPATLAGQLKRTSCVLALPAGAPSAPLALPDLYRRTCDSVMVVGGGFNCGRCHNRHFSTASGYMITESGVMVTNYHVVASKELATTPEEGKAKGKGVQEGLAAMDSHGKVYPVIEVLAADAAADIAVVRLGGSGFHPLALRPDAAVGEPVSIVSHPEQNFYMLSTGIVSQYFLRPQGGQKPEVMCVSAEYGGGSSGGPVLDASGRVVGMVASTHTIAAMGHGPAGAPGAQAQPQTQMVVRNCVPAASILKLIQAPAPTPAK